MESTKKLKETEVDVTERVKTTLSFSEVMFLINDVCSPIAYKAEKGKPMKPIDTEEGAAVRDWLKNEASEPCKEFNRSLGMIGNKHCMKNKDNSIKRNPKTKALQFTEKGENSKTEAITLLLDKKVEIEVLAILLPYLG